MLLLQETEKSSAYEFGYKVGEFTANHPILSIIIGVLIAVIFVYIIVRFVKTLSTFGE